MGTSTDSTGRQESDQEIPWSCVNYCIINKLVQLLNPDSVYGNDWKGLASRLGYSTANILAIESGKTNNTEELFKDYGRNPSASFNQVYSCLEDMKRHDCTKVLQNHFDEIKQAYHRQREQPSSTFHLSGGEMHSPSGQYWSSHSGPSHMCGCISQPMMGHHYPSHPCCSVHDYRGSHHSPCSLQTHQHRMPNYPYGSHQTHSHKPVHYDCSQAPGYLPSYLQMNVQLDGGPVPGPSGNPNASQYTNNFRERNMSGPASRQPVTSMAQTPGPSYNFDRSVPNGQLPHGITGESHPNILPEMSLHQIGPQYVKGQADRMPIQDHYKTYTNNMHLPHNISPQDNSNLVSIGSSDMSNTSNSWQHIDVSLNRSQTSLIADNAAIGGTPCADRSDYREAQPMDTKDSLEKLAEISKVPNEYKPTEEYTRIVAEQKIEEKKSNKGGKNNSGKQTPSIASRSSSCSSKSGGSRTGAIAVENSNTYPLRAKIQANDMTRDFASISIKKSPSLPQSYKSQMYQRVHGARLFVTYSSDSVEHKADILRLCVFLKDNNFKSYVDVKDIPQDKENGKQSEPLSRCETADHVLMCISPKYLEDISKPEPPSPSEKQLHTHQVYTCMRQEHLDNLKKDPSPPRVVILLFSSVTCDMLPEWMRKYPTYKWPSDYEDLFWILMNPQDKIKAKCSNAGSL